MVAYKVWLKVVSSETYEVDASSPEEAKDRAYDRLPAERVNEEVEVRCRYIECLE